MSFETGHTKSVSRDKVWLAYVHWPKTFHNRTKVMRTNFVVLPLRFTCFAKLSSYCSFTIQQYFGKELLDHGLKVRIRQILSRNQRNDFSNKRNEIDSLDIF